MKKTRLGGEFFVSAFIAMIATAILLCFVYQQETIDKACDAIRGDDYQLTQERIDDVWFINSCGSGKETMLMAACESGNSDAIAYLLSRGADPNITAPGHLTPIELFCKTGYESGPRTLKMLLENGVDQSSYTSSPAVFYLAENYCWMNEEQKEIATGETILLLQYGAPLIHNGTSLLHLAAKGNMVDLFDVIVHTTDGIYLLSMKDKNGDAPWDVAVNSGSVGIQKVIRNLEKEWEEEQKLQQEQNGDDGYPTEISPNDPNYFPPGDFVGEKDDGYTNNSDTFD